MRIVVYYDPPPIPVRNMDYHACDADNYEPGAPLGFGPSEAAALDDLREQYFERLAINDTEGEARIEAAIKAAMRSGVP